MSRVRPILFNTDMVQAILAGRKTVTRRLVRPTYRADESGFKVMTNLGTGERQAEKIDDEERTFDPPRYVIPPYQPGDILYVRETWAFKCCLDCEHCNFDPIPGTDEVCTRHKTPIMYEDKYSTSEGCYIYRADYPRPDRIIWRPSIHMPKAAARIWLEVTDVKIQRLQEMRLDDFLNEGVIIRPEILDNPNNAESHGGYKFQCIWNSTIQPQDKDKYGWNANPWVWAYNFKRCKKPMEVAAE